MKLRAPVLAVLLLPLVAGCDSVFGPHEREELAAAEARWAQSRPANYQFEIKLSCFCGNVYSEFTRLDVRSDSVVAATFATPQPGIPNPPVVGWFTVDQLFSMVHGLAESANDDNYLTEVSVSYDATYGYPTRIDVRCTSNIADCGSTTVTRNLQPLVP